MILLMGLFLKMKLIEPFLQNRKEKIQYLGPAEIGNKKQDKFCSIDETKNEL